MVGKKPLTIFDMDNVIFTFSDYFPLLVSLS